MPDMLVRRSGHESVAIRNKLFVMEGGVMDRGDDWTCEVFDSTCNKFVFLKPLPRPKKLSFLRKAFSFGSEIFLYYNKSILVYDVENNEWLEKSCQVLEDIDGFSYAKVPDLTESI